MIPAHSTHRLNFDIRLSVLPSYLIVISRHVFLVFLRNTRLMCHGALLILVDRGERVFLSVIFLR